jgi:hypothetical protein
MSLPARHSLRWWLAALVAGFALALIPLVASAAGMKPLSGGVGVEGRKAHADYPLKLVFATTKGHYLADIAVTLHDSSGKEVMKAHSSGPWLFLDVPAGQYKVVAMRKNGEKASAMVNVTGSGQTVANLAWKAAA